MVIVLKRGNETVLCISIDSISIVFHLLLGTINLFNTNITCLVGPTPPIILAFPTAEKTNETLHNVKSVCHTLLGHLAVNNLKKETKPSNRDYR